ncbi:MAG: hypothetical protein FE78DRAFT_37425 [Acidomyces sp. 'richmondensis']|nr:MAG: hypothetical protein FE78DRAFT_37425 [Acidomyces sp. 'richmondensis']
MRCYRDHSRGAQIAPSDSSSSSSSSVLGSSTVSEQRRQRSSWWNQDDRQLPQQQVQESDCRWGHSEETLFWTGRLERVDSQDTLVELPCRTGTGRMSETAVGQNVVERRRSYGIGGAGNMRFPSQVKAAEQAIAAPDHGGRGLGGGGAAHGLCNPQDHLLKSYFDEVRREQIRVGAHHDIVMDDKGSKGQHEVFDANYI